MNPSPPAVISTGIAALDDILGGGLPANRLHLVQGNPGSGKTTMALQFLLEGVRLGEAGIYVTLSETAEELRTVAASHGWSLDGVELYELPATEAAAGGDYTLFHPSEVELNETTRGVLEVVERVRPRRVVFDSLSEMRLLARDPLRYRRQILALKQYFVGRECTVVLLDDRTAEVSDLQLESLAHGVIELMQVAPEYGAERRRLMVSKLRGARYRGGHHDFAIVTGGLRVYPRLVAAEHRRTREGANLPSGVPGLDALLGGGLDASSSTLISGPAGSGKSTIAMRFALSAAERGENAVFFSFEEGPHTLLARMRGLGWAAEAAIASGRLHLQQIDPAEMSVGEFSERARSAAVEHHASVVVIDSLNGYLSAMPQERHMILHLHEVLGFLTNRGVASILVMAQSGIIGTSMHAPVDVSYLADAVVHLRYFETGGVLRTAASVLKKRGGAHERTLREMTLDARGLHVGEPLRELHGVMTGVPLRISSGGAPGPAPDAPAR